MTSPIRSTHATLTAALLLLSSGCGDGNGDTARVESALATAQQCQAVSNEFGVAANVTFGFAPNDVQNWWSNNACNTTPNTSTDLCQKASEIFGIAANVTWGFAPTETQQWWTANGCNTAPLFQESLCKRAADTYGLSSTSSGSAPPYVKSWWSMNGCNESRHSVGICEMIADFYGVVANQHFGFAPPEVQTEWTAEHCNKSTTTSTAQLCQNAANFYAIVHNQTFGGAPAGAQSWWTSMGCAATPTCQGMSEMFGIRAGVTWGAAGSPASPVPQYIQNWWTQNNCQTSTLFTNDTCQQVANVFYNCVSASPWMPGFLQQFCQLAPCNTGSQWLPDMADASNYWHFMPSFFGVAPLLPTGLTITNKTSSTVSFSFTQNDPGPIGLWVDGGRAPDGSARVVTYASIPNGPFNGSLSLTNLGSQTTPCIRLRAWKAGETPTYTIWTNTVCWNATPPAMVNLGLGNGAFFCTPGLGTCNISPTLGNAFKVSWEVCNNGSSTVAATTTKVIQTDPSGTQTVTTFPVSSIASGQCVIQSSANLIVNTSGHWTWDVFADSANQVTEAFEMDNFGGTGNNF